MKKGKERCRVTHARRRGENDLQQKKAFESVHGATRHSGSTYRAALRVTTTATSLTGGSHCQRER